VLLGAAAAFLAPPAEASPAGDARAIRAGLTKALNAGRLNAQQVRSHRRTLGKARTAIGRLPSSRAQTLARVLWLVRLQAPRYNRARAIALFGMLNQNRLYLSRRGLPPSGTDVLGTDGVVYRAGWGYGLQFHPLANVAKLNMFLYREQRRKALRLARALQIRAVPRRHGRVWEYYFPYGGGSPPWTAAMAQAVGAQALARTARRLTKPVYFQAANRAWLSLPGTRLIMSTAGGPWVRHYSFSSMMVLNAQLQVAVSLMDYGTILNRDRALKFADRLEASARAQLHRFDTGHWTHYLPGSEAPLNYHLYHVNLARFLGRRTDREFWWNAHARFDRYSREPPVFKGGASGPTLYPWPADGWRDSTTVRFWVSKISRVNVRAGGQTFRLGQRGRGWHSIFWRPGQMKPGTYRPLVIATDLAGNRGQRRIQPIEIAVDRTPPQVSAKVSGRRLTWSATDAETPWLVLRVRLERAGRVRFLELGRRGFTGRARLAIPRGNWNARLVAYDSTGNRTRVELGVVPN
jgi:hypothetical protein